VETKARRAASWRRSSSCIRAGEVAHLVAAVVVRHLRVRALLGDPERGGAQAGEAAQQRGGERDGEQRGDGEADDGGDQEAVAHLGDEGLDLGELPHRDDRAEPVADRLRHDNLVPVEGAHPLVPAVDPRAEHRLRVRAPELAVIEECRRGALRIARLQRPVEDEHARARLVLDGPDRSEQRRVVVGQRPIRADVRDCLVDLRRMVGDRVLHRLDRLVAQPVLERRQHDERGHAERHHARGEQGEQQPEAQARREPPPHLTAPGTGSPCRARSG
jgi:hypothetical protein